jgi:small subunit ribosomal protein S7
MSRRKGAAKRSINPDPMFQSERLAKFINKVMLDGKKSVARGIVYGAFEIIKKKLNVENPLEVFDKALENAMPHVEVKTRRIGGANYQVPVEIPSNRRQSLAMGWIIQYSRAKPSQQMAQALASELIDCANNQGATIKKREDTHKMAEANKAFAHFGAKG